MRIINPVIVEPLTNEWKIARTKIAEYIAKRKKSGDKAEREAQSVFTSYLERLKAFRVLDPACGSGNFLYLALRALKDLEHKANLDAEALGLHRQITIECSPANVLGIELNHYASELARVVVWIGEIQWMLRNGYPIRRNPILQSLDHIEHRDAVINADGSEAQWPSVDAIIGNPPFLGDKKMRSELGDEYTEALRKCYTDRVPGGADLVVYWFEKARAHIEAGKCQRAGLVASRGAGVGTPGKDKTKMAIYHLHIDSYRRSRGRTAIGGLAYRRGLKASCPVSGKRFNFRTKEEVAFSDFIPSQNDSTDYSQLPNLLKLYEAIEQSEKHPRATLGREIEVALPHELTLPQQVELVRVFVAEVRVRFEAEQAFFDFSIHAKAGNNHAHICMSEREQVSPFVFAKTKRRDWDGEEFVRACREIWQSQTNSALEQVGISQRVDCRSHADRGLRLLPSFHEGKAAYFNSEVKDMNETIKQANQQLQAANDEREARKARVVKLIRPCQSQQDETPCAMECADTWRPYSDVLLEQRYGQVLGFASLSYVNLKHSGRATLHFSDRSKVVDYGNRVECIGSNASTSAERVIRLAIAKGWGAIAFTGNEAFLRASFAMAIEQGLCIVPKDAEQQKILDELRTGTPPASATVMAMPSQPVPFTPKLPMLSTIGGKIKKAETEQKTPTKKRRHGI